MPRNVGAPLHGWVWPQRSPMLSGHGKLVNLVQQTAAATALSLGHPALTGLGCEDSPQVHFG